MAVGPPLELEELERLVTSGHVDTVLVVWTDPGGRLQGERVHARHFSSQVLANGLNLEPGRADPSAAALSAPSGALVLRPDPGTLRPAPWLAGSVMVQGNLFRADGLPVRTAPRQVLAAQVKEAADLGVVPAGSIALQFSVFDATYAAAAERGWTGLPGGAQTGGIGSTNVDEDLLRDLRQTAYNAGLTVQSSYGTGVPGQHDMSFAPDDLIRAADNQVVFRTAATELAHRHDKALTFMARYDDRPGNGARLSMSLRGLDGSFVFNDTANQDFSDGRSAVFRSFVAGVLATLRDFTLLYAPTVNSYKRFRRDSSAPTAITWGEGGPASALRVAGRGETLRVQNRVPGADVNPYLALAGMLAGGLYGIRAGLPLEQPLIGDSRAPGLARVPASLGAARETFAGSDLARNAFGEDVVATVLRSADAELDAFESSVTDWERRRGFEMQ
ncbi:glutamine synthetase family protein [Kineosporia babensis]|uniref:Glutamine synthetase family protein n=1 Tax=Kineosporia babensis TaxID=499548 RepID=A0A9X1T357_9ACTN|nr:glutamine synthetase family protein [Kineosporia babensis]MCD5315328.1 glutamine synthetase family protein [Kineosporia babensis]